MQERQLLQNIVRLAALCCDASEAGLSIRRDGAHGLVAGYGVEEVDCSVLPEAGDGEVALFHPPVGSGWQFGAAVGWAQGLLFVLDRRPRSALTEAQAESLRLLATQAGLTVAVDDELRAATIYRRAFHAANVDLVLIGISPDGDIRLEDGNAVHLAHLGVTAEDFVGRTPEEALGAAAVPARERYAEVIASKAVVEYEREAPFPKGNRVRHSTMTPLFAPDGRVEKILLTSHDLTAMRRAEAQLRQGQKIQALGQLTGGVAHDFNNLLTVIRGGLDLIGAQLDRLPSEVPVARLRRARALSVQGVDRAATLTQRLLAFARRQPLAPRPVDVNVLITGVSDLLHRTLGEAIVIETNLASGLWIIEADGHQLENALLNLALNARDAMPEGGRLLIETANAELGVEEVQSFSEAIEQGDYVMMAVADNGRGMDQATAEQAFEPFFTTKDQGVGTGLGLSQVVGFVRQSGGLVQLSSEIGRGTTVRIYLPRLLEALSEPPGSGPLEDDRTVPTGTETVLVVEDESSLRAYAAGVLRELGYRVIEAADALTALVILESQSRIDLLFTDVVLPGAMNGQQLADAVARRRPALKVLFTSGYARNALMRNGRLEPGVRLLRKPFSLVELAGAVRSAVDGSG